MKIAIGCDPNAQSAKEELIKFMNTKGYGSVTDFGSEDTIYAHVATKVAEAVAIGEYDRGILICGTGIGVSITANKVKGIRCALVHDVFSAKATRAHNDTNMLAMGQWVIGEGLALEILNAWLHTDYEGGRHDARIEKMMKLERE